MYADEIRKHSEDSAKVAQLAKDLEAVKADSEAKIREAQEEREKAAAAALAELEALKAEQEAKVCMAW